MATKKELEQRVAQLEAELYAEKSTREEILDLLKVVTRSDFNREDIDKIEKRVIADILVQMSRLHKFTSLAYFKYDESKNSFVGNYAISSRTVRDFGKMIGTSSSIDPKKVREKSIENLTQIDLEVLLKDDSIFKRIITDGESYLGWDVNYAPIDKKLVRKLGKPFVGIAIKGSREEVIGIVYGRKPATKESFLLTKKELDVSNYIRYPAATLLELINAYRYIQDKSKYIDIGVSAVEFAHEVRKGLMLIGGFLPQISKECASESPDKENIEKKTSIVLSEFKELQKYISMVMDFSKPKEPNPTEFDIVEQLRLKTEQLSKEVRYRINYKGSQLLVYADKDQIMRHTLSNMITNAVEAIRDESTTAGYVRNKPNILTLDIGRFPPDHCIVSIHNRQYIDPDVLRKLKKGTLFCTTKQGKGGYGLGFPIALQRASLNNCILSIESSQKKGTYQRLHLPYKS